MKKPFIRLIGVSLAFLGSQGSAHAQQLAVNVPDRVTDFSAELDPSYVQSMVKRAVAATSRRSVPYTQIQDSIQYVSSDSDNFYVYKITTLGPQNQPVQNCAVRIPTPTHLQSAQNIADARVAAAQAAERQREFAASLRADNLNRSLANCNYAAEQARAQQSSANSGYAAGVGASQNLGVQTDAPIQAALDKCIADARYSANLTEQLEQQRQDQQDQQQAYEKEPTLPQPSVMECVRVGSNLDFTTLASSVSTKTSAKTLRGAPGTPTPFGGGLGGLGGMFSPNDPTTGTATSAAAEPGTNY